MDMGVELSTEVWRHPEGNDFSSSNLGMPLHPQVGQGAFSEY